MTAPVRPFFIKLEQPSWHRRRRLHSSPHATDNCNPNQFNYVAIVKRLKQNVSRVNGHFSVSECRKCIFSAASPPFVRHVDTWTPAAAPVRIQILSFLSEGMQVIVFFIFNPSRRCCFLRLRELWYLLCNGVVELVCFFN